MKTSSTIGLTLILSIGLAANAEAAKENFDRSKPHVQVKITKAQDYNSSRSNNSSNTKAQDYNSSRSNRGIISQGGDDLILRKRPGRAIVTPITNCAKSKKIVKSQTAANCPIKPF